MKVLFVLGCPTLLQAAMGTNFCEDSHYPVFDVILRATGILLPLVRHKKLNLA
jgi:hypothetical protein